MADYILGKSGEQIEEALNLAVTADQLKSGYLYNGAFYTTAEHTLLIPAETKNLYIDLTDASVHKIYHYNGTQYVLLSGGGGDNIVQGYYYNEQFYEEASHTTLIAPDIKNLYIDITNATTENWKVNNSDYIISESHDLKLYKILDDSQVSVSDSGITISGANYNYGSIDSALQNSLTNALMSGYISYVTVSENETAAINMYNNNEIAFYISYIDNELNTLYNVNTLNHTNAELKLYNYINNRYILINDYTKIYNEINNKQDELTIENGTTITDLDTVSDVNLTTNKVIKRTFTQVWNWIISKLSTIITSDSTNAQIPSSEAVYNLFDSKRLYQHIFGIKYSNLTSFYGIFYIFTTDDTPFTYDTLAKWLFDKGFTDENTQYPMCSGSDDFVNRYASNTSGGTNTTQFVATGPIIGLCSPDGLTIQYYYNRASSRSLSKTQGKGTWIQNVSILRIL